MYRKVCIFLISATFFQSENATEVTIEQGTLLGKTFTSRNGRPFRGYLGIPYAKPPLGDLRFQPPHPPEPWNGVRNATELPEMCIQNLFGKGIIGQEDCLSLNVYLPAEKSKTNPLPVMVFIHGGFFVYGGSVLHNPKYFMDHDVIVVTIAYRLNILGFFSTGDNVVPGNNGMKDQVMALKWVQKNIAAFGGNPNRVTIFGQSAGAMSVHYHMFSPLSKGLFHQAIIQSGSALSIASHARSALIRERVHALGTLLYCPTKNSQKLVECLKQIPAKELLMAHDKLNLWNFEPTIQFPIVSEPSTVENAFIHENPWYQNEITNVPLIIGMVSNEGLLRTADYLANNGEKIRYINEHYEKIWPMSLLFMHRFELGERTDQMVKSIKKFYFRNKNISTETWKELTNLYSDVYFTHDVIEFTKRYKHTKYFYYYDHRNEVSTSDLLGDSKKNYGVCHGDDLISLFYFPSLFPEITKGDDLKVSERLIEYWVNFTTTGNPDPSGIWNPMKSNTTEFLHITSHKDEMKVGLLEDRYQYWKNLNIAPIK